jgi:hypothetical protein
MKSTLLVIMVAALLAPVAALADDSAPAPTTVAKQQCTQLRTSMGAAAFANTYGTNANKANAFGKCVAKQSHSAETTVTNAAQACKAEQAKDSAAFAAKYGTNGKSGDKGAGKNPFGKCVSAAVEQATTEQTEKLTHAATACRAALKASATDFAAKYGSKRNAFGKCVSAMSKTTTK